MTATSRTGVQRSGMTLIELIVVIAILASVAGLVVSAVSMLGRASDMAVSASTQADLTNNIQQHFVLQKRYPQGLDSLLVATSTAPNPSGIYLPTVREKATPFGYVAVRGFGTGSEPLFSDTTHDADDQINGLPLAGPDLWKSLAPDTLSANQRKSLTRGGLDWVFDHDVTATNSNSSNTLRRDLSSATGTTLYATLNPDPTSTPAASANPALPLIKQLAPRDFATGTYIPENGTKIVAFGIGSQCSLLGNTSTNIPTYPGNDGKYYGRYVVYFKVYESGERAALLGVSDAYGRLPDYTQGQFNEALPNGGRKG